MFDQVCCFIVLVILFKIIALIVDYNKRKTRRHGSFISDKYKTLGEVTKALREAGLESSNLIIGIDYTKSNDFNGKFTFGGKSLHHLDSTRKNPYQQVIEILGRTLADFDEDQKIPTYGFGDSKTKNHSVFPLAGAVTLPPNPQSSNSFAPSAPPADSFYPPVPGQTESISYPIPYTFKEVISQYNEVTPLLIFSGPTSFSPLIRQAVRVVKGEDFVACSSANSMSYEYHILVIIADGQVIDVDETRDAIVEASNYPLSIVMVGVGDGPWDMMEQFDDDLPARRFDNFQFVNFHTSLQSKYPEPNFALRALMEILISSKRLGD